MENLITEKYFLLTRKMKDYFQKMFYIFFKNVKYLFSIYQPNNEKFYMFLENIF